LRSFAIKVYGCQMNVYDADRIRTALVSTGWEEVLEDVATLVIFVTCSIREKAEQKVLSEIGRIGSRSAEGQPVIAVVGCMAQRIGDSLLDRFPAVRLVCGPRNLGRLLPGIDRIMDSRERLSILDENPVSLEDLGVSPLYRENPWKAYITIAHGCDNFCTYCIVPHVRGRFMSRDPEGIFREVQELVSSGVREIILIGQNVNTYGHDFGNDYRFSSLLDDVASMKGVNRIRFCTSHPKDLTEDVVRVMSRRPSICTGINLPIQSGSDRILGLMNRGYTVEKYASIIEMIRDHLPEPSVTSDLIVGFPGETDDDFRESVRVVEKFRFDLVHTAAYSPRDGTPAARMDGQVPFAVKKRRLAEINRIQEDITMAINDALVGREFEVLVDGFAPRGDSMLQGRTSADKVVIFPGDASLLGSFRMVRITGSGNWSLRGEIIPEGTQ